MQPFLTLISHSEKELFDRLAFVSKTTGTEAFIVGGFVRDKLLGRLTKDIDIVCIGDGIAFATTFQQTYYSNRTVHVFKNFGTAQLELDDCILEFVGARKESYHTTSRNPNVETGTFLDDQLRRDFTINTLAVKISDNEKHNAIIDTFNGLQALQDKTIITPQNPEKTFSDDPLRILRAIRFACQLEFTIEGTTLQAMQKNANRLSIVAKERIAEELNKMMLSSKPSVGFLLLDQIGLLESLLPELLLLKGVACIDGVKHKDNFYHSLQVLDNITTTTNNVWLRWAALLHDIGKPTSKRYHAQTGWTFHGHEMISAKMIPKIFQRLGFPLHEKMNFVKKIISLHHRPISLTTENITDSAVRRLLFDAGNDVEDLMLLCEADITSKNKQKVAQYLSNFYAVREKMLVVEEKDKIRNWQAPISGEIIMETFSLKPCKEIGIIKEAIKDAIFDGIIENNVEQAMTFMKEFVLKNKLV